METRQRILVRKDGSWLSNLSVRAFAICLSVWLFSACVMLLQVPVFYPLLQEPELRLRDQFFSWRRLASHVADVRMPSSDKVVLITIDDTAVREIGSYPPWPRVLYSTLVNKLAAAGTSVIGFVMVFDSLPIDDKHPISPKTAAVISSSVKDWQQNAKADDQRFRTALAGFANVVLASFSDLRGRSAQVRYPLETFSNPLGGAAAVGTIFVVPDEDGVVRRAPLVSSRALNAGQLESAFGLRVLEKRLQATAIASDGSVRVREKKIPACVGINFAGQGAFGTVPFSRVLSGPLPERLFKDKVVLVGFQQYRAPDGEPTPSFLTPVGQTRMSALEVQGHIVNSLLTGRFISEPTDLELAAIMFLCSMLLAYLFHVFSGHPWGSIAGIAVMSFTCIVWSFLCFVYLDFFVPSVVLILGLALPSLILVMADQNLLVFRERRKHTRLFHGLVSRAQAQEIDRQKLSSLALEGKLMTVTLLVCEVDGLRALVERLKPAEAIKAVDVILTGLSEAVHNAGGMVWKFDSCGLTAVWGAPLGLMTERQIDLALECSGKIRDRVYADFSRLAQGIALAWPCPGLVVSITTGEAVCGRVGAEDFGSYGIVGKVVDQAEGYLRACRQLQVEFIVNETAAGLIAESRGEVRELDESELHENTSNGRLYEYLGQRGRISGVREESSSLYAQAIASFRAADYQKAEALLLQALHVWPEDAPALRLLEKSRRLKVAAAADAGQAGSGV